MRRSRGGAAEALVELQSADAVVEQQVDHDAAGKQEDGGDGATALASIKDSMKDERRSPTLSEASTYLGSPSEDQSLFGNLFSKNDWEGGRKLKLRRKSRKRQRKRKYTQKKKTNKKRRKTCQYKRKRRRNKTKKTRKIKKKS